VKRFLLAGFIVFLCVLIATFPARVAYNWLAVPGVTLSGISGSVWNGNAAEGLAGGAYVRDISWRFKPLTLFSGKLAFATSSKPVSGSLVADIAVSFDGSLTLSDLSGNVPLDLVHQSLQHSGISGDVALDFATLILRDGIPVVAEGSIRIANLYVAQLSSAPLGEYRIDFRTMDDGIHGNLEDVSGVLEVAGVININADRSYALSGEVAARADAPPSVSGQLRYLGSPNERGRREFSIEGEI